MVDGILSLSPLGNPLDEDLQRYPAVHLTGPHEWDPSVLASPTHLVMGSLLGQMTILRDLPLTPIFDEFGD